MAAASCSNSPITQPLAYNPHLTPLSTTVSQQRLNTSCAFSFRVLKYRYRVISILQESAALTSNSWNPWILKSETPVLVEFYTSWCEPCKMLHQLIDEIAADYDGELECVAVNVEQEPPLAEEYDIKAVPIILLFKNGEKRESVVGTMPKDFFVAAIE